MFLDSVPEIEKRSVRVYIGGAPQARFTIWCTWLSAAMVEISRKAHPLVPTFSFVYDMAAVLVTHIRQRGNPALCVHGGGSALW